MIVKMNYKTLRRWCRPISRGADHEDAVKRVGPRLLDLPISVHRRRGLRRQELERQAAALKAAEDR
jgi:hypothetical protein